jgi:DNA-binding NtrC family response regulator
MNQTSALNRKKVLVVDDEQPICDMLRLALERCGYTVFTANAAEDALAIMDSQRCPVMLLDFSLPETDGMGLFKRIKAGHPDSIGFLLTGWASEENLLACYAAGFKHCFTKPVSLARLYESVRQAFENPPVSPCRTPTGSR